MKRMQAFFMAVIMLLSIPVYVSAQEEYAVDESVISAVGAETKDTSHLTRKKLSEGVKNIVKRADQMNYIRWTPKKDIVGWEEFLTYKAGVTYTGLPYGQPIYASYVPWYTSLDGFIAAVNNPKSKMYTSKSTYNEVAPYYSVDCSAYVSWAWGLPKRQTTAGIPEYSQLISKTSIRNAQVGDALCKKYSHVVLITDIACNEKGEIVFVEISEATAKENTDCCCVVTTYGEGSEKSIEELEKKYFGDGFYLYRYPQRDSVTYTHNCNIPLEGDKCSKCRADGYTVGEAVYGSVKITAERAFSCVIPANNAQQVSSYRKDCMVNVIQTAKDGNGKLWYRAEDGGWLNAQELEFYENRWCTSWSQTVPEGVDEAFIEEKSFYRSAAKEYVTSEVSELEGYSYDSKKWVKYNTVSLRGVAQWPDNFDKSSSLYKKYDLTDITPLTDGDYRRTVSKTVSEGYLYYHYCNGKSKYASSTKTDTKTKLHYFVSDVSPDTLEKYGKSRIISNKACSGCERYYPLPYVRIKYNEFRREYTHYRHGAWSEWSAEPIEETKEIKVEEKLFYRYNDTAHSWTLTSVQSEADCRNEGIMLYTCDGCGAEKTRYIPAGEHTVPENGTVTKKATFEAAGVISFNCTVCGKKLREEKIPAIERTAQGFTSRVYNGKMQTPSVKVYDSEGNRLVYKTDFTVKYPSGRTKPGKYTAKITFMGKYEGEKLITFTIRPSSVSLSAKADKNSVTLNWGELPEATGYRVFRYNTKTKKYKALKTTWDTTYTDTTVEPGKKYYYVVKSYTKVKGEYYWSTHTKVAITTKRK